MGYIHDEIDSAIGKRWRIVLTVIAALIAGYLILALIGGIWPFSSAAKVAQKVTSAESIIGNYQYFYDQYNSIEAMRANVKIMTAAAKKLYGDAKEKKLEEAQGTLLVLNVAIGEYNSRSRQITRNLWKADDLPHQIKLEVLE